MRQNKKKYYKNTINMMENQWNENKVLKINIF